MEDADRRHPLEAYLPSDVRSLLERRFWHPIEAQARLEVLRDDPSFFEDPGRHPAVFADHGVVHVRDVAVGLIDLVDGVDGLLLAARPPERRAFLATYGVALAYLHDVGMVDMSLVGRRVHPQYGAHAAWWPDADPLVEHLLAQRGPVRDRLDAVARAAPFAVPVEIVARELLSLTAAHSKSTIPAATLEDRTALRQSMQRILFTSLSAHRAAVGGGAGKDEDASHRSGPALRTHDEREGEPVARHPEPNAAFAWLDAADGAQAELADDVIDTVRLLRAADVLRQRGSDLRTSAGYEICFDARTADAVCTLRTASGDAAYVITYADPRGAGEANIRVAWITPQGHLRIAFHRGSFPSAAVERRAAESAAHAILDIVGDVIPSFGGPPARGLPPPSRRNAEMRIQIEQPDDDPSFADLVLDVLRSVDPALEPRLQSAANLETAAPSERGRFFLSRRIEGDSAFIENIRGRLIEHGTDVPGQDRPSAFAEVGVAVLRGGEVLVTAGSAPAFVYVPLGPGLVVQPGGGYAPSPLQPWVPVGTTGVIRRAERNSRIVAWQDVEVLMIPGERYARDWLRPLRPEQLRERLQQPDGVATE